MTLMKKNEIADSVEPITNEHSEIAWAHDTLDPDQVSTAKRSYARCKLGKGITILLWALRVYVAFMILLVALHIWNTLHAAK